MKASKKIQAILKRRLAIHAKGPTSSEAAVKNRWSNGGFKKPGSQNRHKPHSGGRRK